ARDRAAGRPAPGPSADVVRRAHGPAGAHPVRGGAGPGHRRHDGGRAGERRRLPARHRAAGAALLRAQPDRRPAGAPCARCGRAAGHRQRLRDRHPQQHAGHRRGDQRPGQRGTRRPGGRLRRPDVPGGRRLRLGGQPLRTSPGTRGAAGRRL
ncbi:MAG: Sodium-dependent transporter, partial [uncultured Blastococcus sp.]